MLPSALLVLQSGLYVAVSSNAPSICPQQVEAITHRESGELLKLKIYYSGDCADDGPYIYECDPDQKVCESPTERITVVNETQYRWENLVYSFEGVFQRKL